jgi:hypothetical protein
VKPQRFTKRPVVVEAVQLTEDEDWEAVAAWASVGGGHPARVENRSSAPGMEPESVMVIPTLEGDMLALSDDWVIRGIAGEHYPCKPDIFAQTYQPVVEAAVDEGAMQEARNERIAEAAIKFGRESTPENLEALVEALGGHAV